MNLSGYMLKDDNHRSIYADEMKSSSFFIII